jgi:hypothetical protein
MERKLATIARIDEIHPIKDADAIERATIWIWNNSNFIHEYINKIHSWKKNIRLYMLQFVK